MAVLTDVTRTAPSFACAEIEDLRTASLRLEPPYRGQRVAPVAAGTGEFHGGDRRRRAWTVCLSIHFCEEQIREHHDDPRRH